MGDESVIRAVEEANSLRPSRESRLAREWVERAGKNLELTYFVRLTAEFEGILKDHLATNHPTVAVPDKPKVDQLIHAVAKAESFLVGTKLRTKLNEVRDYRNAVAHQGAGVTPVTFDEALSRYTTFVSKLPDPQK